MLVGRWAFRLTPPGITTIISTVRRSNEDGVRRYFCISFLIMERLQLREAAATDHHFVQAGFVALLTAAP